jgi:hypothetical protein
LSAGAATAVSLEPAPPGSQTIVKIKDKQATVRCRNASILTVRTENYFYHYSTFSKSETRGHVAVRGVSGPSLEKIFREPIPNWTRPQSGTSSRSQ